ncbi:MAG TPA: ATP-binding protein [Terracidiphilus sp.]|nr:ATP-binding protein [Terracidiphilus sp.]
MTKQPLPSCAENRAYKAQSLTAFSGFNLVGVRTNLEELLNQIGRNDLFAEYTKHDISHIDKLLGMLDWIIPKDTTKAMTPIDWMLVVLSIYFHDAGLVVTKTEFERRDESDFPRFREEILGDSRPSQFQERARSLDGAAQELFLYQEFVRVHHAERIRCWISGDTCDRFGVASEASALVSQLLGSLDDDFKRDLAMICKSHHDDDLNDLRKYNPRRAYGSTQSEIANLQYAAILLRTVDLLHVTKDRTPSVAFALATPTDPKSLEEWAKQMSTVAVSYAPPRDQYGNVKNDQAPDTIQVSATFKDPLGYFALTEYLHYAEGQLRRSYEWAEQTAARESIKYQFPWRKIDTTQVTALGFVSEQFRFELDRSKILNLLTGHTLYSNSEVVARELIQNSLDAIRLQKEISGAAGEIAIHLDTQKRELTFDDNGTGMTQKIIEEHFFNVGSSRYRDESFKKMYPHFAAISRFGIGILSVFMVSDEIEVITKPAEESDVRNISIRSLTGKYLIRILKPGDLRVPNLMKKHGTRVQLKLRPGVAVPDIRRIADFWIQIPECAVTVTTDCNPPVCIGRSSPKEILEEFLSRSGCKMYGDEADLQSTVFKIEEKQRNGLIMAYALRWQPAYANWSFAGPADLNVAGPVNIPSAVCIQGVRVETTAPGFAAPIVLAISNMSGERSPATNVARSNIESGPLTDEMFDSIYAIYLDHVTREIEDMVSTRNQSPSLAVSEGRYLLAALQGDLGASQCPKANELFRSRLIKMPLLTLDSGETRSLVSIEQLKQRGGFWTVESGANKSAEEFLRKVPTNASLFQLAAMSGSSLLTNEGDVLGGYADNRRVKDLVISEFEVDRIELQDAKRQANLHWRPRKERQMWKGILPKREEKRQKVEQLMQSTGRYGVAHGVRYRAMVLQESDDVMITGASARSGLAGSAQTYIFKGNGLHELLSESHQGLETGKATEAEFALVLLVINLFLSEGWMTNATNRARMFRQFQQQIGQQSASELRVSAELQELIDGEKYSIFDPLRGDRFNLWHLSGVDYFD